MRQALMACALTASLTLPLPALAACPGDTQVEMNQCAQAAYLQADATLNALWQTVKPQYDAMGAGDVLLDAQRKWIAFRDAACIAEAAPYQGGSIQPLVQATCLTRITDHRIEDLRSLAN